LFLLDSIAHISELHAKQVVISGSHGGRSAAEFVLSLKQKPSCVFFNDAGGGKDDAGKVALQMLQVHGIPCACYAHLSACIGDAQDGLDNGIVSGLNPQAQALGLNIGMTVKEAVIYFEC
jgi:hypothetical protein